MPRAEPATPRSRKAPYPARWLCEQLARSRIEASPGAGYSEHPPGRAAGPRKFNDYDIHFIVAGTLEYAFSHKTVRATPGRFCLLPPGKPFHERETSQPPAGVRLYFAHFAIGSAGPDPLRALDLPLAVRAQDPADSERLFRRLVASTRAARDGDPWGRLRANGELVELLAGLLASAVRDGRLFFDPKRLGPAWLWDAVETIEKGLERTELDVESLARRAHLSGSQFAHQFRRHLGVSPMKLLARKRMERASALLASDRDLTVKEIAAACGFPDPYHFSARFKKWARVSPSEFRRQVAERGPA